MGIRQKIARIYELEKQYGQYIADITTDVNWDST